jgi:hypothetical protein
MATYTPNFNSNTGSFCGDPSWLRGRECSGLSASDSTTSRSHVLRSIGIAHSSSERDTQSSTPQTTTGKHKSKDTNNNNNNCESDNNNETLSDPQTAKAGFKRRRHAVHEHALTLDWELFADQTQHMTKDRTHYHGVLHCVQHLDAALELLRDVLVRKRCLRRSLRSCDGHWDGGAAAAVLMQDVQATERQTDLLWRSVCASVLALRAHERGLVECAQSHRDLSRRATREVSTLQKKLLRAEARAAQVVAVAAAEAAADATPRNADNSNISSSNKPQEECASAAVASEKEKERAKVKEASQRTNIMIQIKQHDGEVHSAIAADEQRLVETVRAMLARLPSTANPP